MVADSSGLEERAEETDVTVREVQRLDAKQPPVVYCPLSKKRVPVQGYCLSEYGGKTPYCTFVEGVNYQDSQLISVVCCCRF